MRYLHTLASYVPSIVVSHVVDTPTMQTPCRQTFETCVVFCDVSGFTKLAERMQATGKGAEGLKKYLNSYFEQMARIIAKSGGDIFKFAGDAMIVLWPPSDDPLENRMQRAAAAAIQIQQTIPKMELEQGALLKVKIGIGVGMVTVLHLGGVNGHVEYVAVGEPLVQAFEAEHHGSSEMVIASPEAWRYLERAGFKRAEKDDKVDKNTKPEDKDKGPHGDRGDGFVRLNNEAEVPPTRMVSIATMLNAKFEALTADPQLEKLTEDRLKGYVPTAIAVSLSRASRDDEKWANEIRQMSTMFVNLGLPDKKM